jgi:hypothetical protein
VIDDAWLAELLERRTDAASAAHLAPALAQHFPDLDARGLVTRTLLDALDRAWERGWQPADVAHAVRRDAPAGCAPLVVALIAEHARRTDAVARAPHTWVDQLRELGADGPGESAVVATWHRGARCSPAEAWRIVLQLLFVLRSAVRLEALVPPPSRWGAARARPDHPVPDGDRALRRSAGCWPRRSRRSSPRRRRH